MFAAGLWRRLKWVCAWPLCLLLYFTVPDSSRTRWEKCFMLSFVFSTLWIAAFSYVMVWMVRLLHHPLVAECRTTDWWRDSEACPCVHASVCPSVPR